MWTPQYDIIVETLTGSEFVVTVTDKDTIGYIKSRIQKYEGIPIGQQHLLYNHKELSDATEMKDVPLANGSRLKLVLDMKGGPVSARRVVNLPDYDNWFDLSDVLNTTRHDPLTISTPGVKLLVYKDCKKNIHRIMKFRSDRKNYGTAKNSDSNNFASDSQDDQWVKDNVQTLEKMLQLRSKLEMKKKNKNTKSKKDTLGTNKNELDVNQREDIDHIEKSQLNDLDSCLKAKKAIENKSKLLQSDRVNNSCDYSMQVRRPSTGLLNKYGLNKTCIRMPSVIAQPKKNENFFQLHALSPLSPPPPPYNSLSRSQEIDLQSKYNTQHMNAIKNNICNLAINRPKSKQNVSSNCSEETRSKLRENIRRNRSFKTINATTDLTSCDDKSSINPNHSLSNVLDKIFGNPYGGKSSAEKKTTSKSVQDLIEKLSSTKLGHKQHNIHQHQQQFHNDLCELPKAIGVEQERELRLSKRGNCLSGAGATTAATATTSSGFENKLFIDRQQTIGLNPIDTAGCAPDYKLENTAATTNSALDGSFRLYKMSAEAKNNYELPKLLIREDSPVESFHSSDPQLETLTIRGESPKNVLDSYPKLTTNGSDIDAHHTACERDSKSSKTIIKSPWNSHHHHHHSDLGLNNLELNFLNEEYSDLDAGRDSDNCLQNGSVLKIASNLEINSSWNNSSELDGQSQPSTTSLNFINGDLTSSDDEEDVFNGSCCMLHSNSKSKSIELNDFRMMFGSSPTLLNTNYNSVTHASRLDAVPIQYRRGYTNLNDACLSSSTSDLELFNGVRKKNSSKSASQELPSSFSRHHHRTTNGSLDFVRSYENLDRTKILRMKNERSRNLNSSSSISDTKPFWDNSNNNNNNGSSNKRCQSSMQNNFSRERLQEEDLCDDDYSFSNLGYDNTITESDSIGTSKCLPIGFPSDESIFNMNLDRFTDDFNLLSSTSLSDRLSTTSGNNNSKEASRSSLILSELDNDGVGTFRKYQTTTTTNINNNKIDTATILAAAAAAASSSLSSVHHQPLINKKSEKQRCAECNKKLGLIMIMKCHCEKIFCPQHRYAEAHNCSYNFKSEGKKILTRENPLVVAQKLPKI